MCFYCIFSYNTQHDSFCFVQVQVPASEPARSREHLYRDQPRQVQYFPCKNFILLSFIIPRFSNYNHKPWNLNYNVQDDLFVIIDKWLFINNAKSVIAAAKHHISEVVMILKSLNISRYIHELSHDKHTYW